MEYFVFADLHFYVEIAARRSGRPGFPFSAHRQTGPRENAPGNAYFQAALDAHATSAHAVAAGIGNNPAASPTGPAGLLDPEKALIHENDPLAFTLTARGGVRSFFASRTGTI